MLSGLEELGKGDLRSKSQLIRDLLDSERSGNKQLFTLPEQIIVYDLLGTSAAHCTCQLRKVTGADGKCLGIELHLVLGAVVFRQQRHEPVVEVVWLQGLRLGRGIDHRLCM